MASMQKIIDLIKKTGDKAIVLDQNGEPAYVIMSLADYEDLTLGKSEVSGLTEAELLSKINRDIAIWKDIKEANDLPIDQYDFAKDLGNFREFNEDSEFEPDWEVESLADHKNPDDDRYYFEPVE